MKVRYELPTDMEIRGLKRTDRGFEWEVVAMRGQPLVGSGFFTVTGAGGMEVRSIARVSVKNGGVQAHNVDALAKDKVEFDLPPEEWKRRRAGRPQAPKPPRKEPGIATPPH